MILTPVTLSLDWGRDQYISSRVRFKDGDSEEDACLPTSEKNSLLRILLRLSLKTTNLVKASASSTLTLSSKFQEGQVRVI